MITKVVFPHVERLERIKITAINICVYFSPFFPKRIFYIETTLKIKYLKNCIYVYMCIYVYTYLHKYTHTYTHTILFLIHDSV